MDTSGLIDVLWIYGGMGIAVGYAAWYLNRP